MSGAARRASPAGERGMALAVALFALVILGALVSVSFAVGRMNRAAAATVTRTTAAQSAAEAALTRGIDAWDPVVHASLPSWNGTPATEWSTGPVAIGTDSTVVGIAAIGRLNDQLYLFRGVGQRLDRSGGLVAELSVGQLLRTSRPTVIPTAALTAGGPVTFVGSAFTISGINTLPPQWGVGCAPLDPTGLDDLAGIRSLSTTGAGPAHAGNVVGVPVPAVAHDSSVTGATFSDFVDATYTGLVGLPIAKQLPTGVLLAGVQPVLDSAGACDRAAPLNLGEPFRNPGGGAVAACATYAPLAHGTGPATVFAVGARGQGMLLVDGDLEVRGGFVWAGVIVVRGALVVTGLGNRIYGAVLVEGVAAGAGSVAGDLQIHYSDCAVRQALSGAATVRPLSARSWLQLY